MMPVQVTIRDISSSKALEEHIRAKVEKLAHYYRQIQNCHVVVELPQKHKHQGKLFSVHIDLNVPGKELVVDRKQNENVYVAVRNAFNALKRQISAYVHRRRGDVKGHDKLTRARRNNILMKMDTPSIH
ncbi:MAG: hypothetical protein K0S27_1369 [Gammaproteobacteria bacterium]|jgi:ribosomal subunit interface protein|nr:hypothetical protein [Gammaproteobacteria bacterium]